LTQDYVNANLDTMRIASFNIYNGAQDTYPLLLEFVANHDIDVLCLQEANEWQHGSPSRLEKFACATGLSHYVFGDSNTDCKLATFSRLPIVASRVHTEGLWHCAVQTTIRVSEQTVPVWNTHLNPFHEDRRLPEAAFLARAAKNGIIAMDSNSLSRADSYPPTLIEELASHGNDRYGDKELRYDVTDYFARHGFIDAAAALGVQENTFPARTDTELFPPELRLDYIFVPPKLADTLEGVEVIKNPETMKISDHFPLVVQLGNRLLSGMVNRAASLN
jgi:endonuclease/exonuclease/phosphatase family metal-dependent hydrolase